MRSPLAATLLAGLAAGCSFFETMDECADLAATVNPALAELALDGGASETPSHMRHVASVYASLAERLAGKGYQSARLSPLVAQYADLAQKVASNAQTYADALEGERTRTQRAAITASRQHVALQGGLNRRIHSVCSGR